MTRILLGAVLLVIWSAQSPAQSVRPQREWMRHCKECIWQKMDGRTYTATGLDTLMRDCFLQSFRHLPNNAEYTFFSEDDYYERDVDDFSNYFEGVTLKLALECPSLMAFLKKVEDAFNEDKPTIRVGSTTVVNEQYSPDEHHVLVLQSDTAGVIVKVNYIEQINQSTLRKKYPLYYEGKLVGYTNDRAFRVEFPREQPNYYYSEPIPGATDLPLRLFRPVTLELNVHKDDSIYPLAFEVLREYVAVRD